MRFRGLAFPFLTVLVVAAGLSYCRAQAATPAADATKPNAKAVDAKPTATRTVATPPKDSGTGKAKTAAKEKTSAKDKTKGKAKEKGKTSGDDKVTADAKSGEEDENKQDEKEKKDISAKDVAEIADFSNFDADQVSLYYFTDIPRLMYALNEKVQTVGGAADAAAKAAQQRADLAKSESDLGDAQAEVNRYQRQTLELEEQQRQEQANLLDVHMKPATPGTAGKVWDSVHTDSAENSLDRTAKHAAKHDGDASDIVRPSNSRSYSPGNSRDGAIKRDDRLDQRSRRFAELIQRCVEIGGRAEIHRYDETDDRCAEAKGRLASGTRYQLGREVGRRAQISQRRPNRSRPKSQQDVAGSPGRVRRLRLRSGQFPVPVCISGPLQSRSRQASHALCLQRQQDDFHARHPQGPGPGQAHHRGVRPAGSASAADAMDLRD